MNSEPCLHLDADVLIHALTPGHGMREQLRHWSGQGRSLAVSALAWSEFVCGPVSITAVRAWARLLDGAIVPLNAAMAEQAALLFNITGRRSHSLPACIIAASAMIGGAELVTLRQVDYAPFLPHGLVLAPGGTAAG